MANTPKKKKRRWGDKAIILLLLLAIIFGFSLLLPSYFEEKEQKTQLTQEVETFREMVSQYDVEPCSSGVKQDSSEDSADGEEEEIQEEQEEPCTPDVFPELWEAMQAYNQKIYEEEQSGLVDAWSYQAKVVDLTKYGYWESAIGVVTIPDISVEMPLYLGATYANMNKGFAQMSQTSMPIGGINTNCVIVGHRGWNGLPYMRDVEQLEIGDSVFLQNPWETLEYRIDEILLIEPNDVEAILLQEGRDLLSVVTCHPYGNGTHRYVLICERYYPETASEEAEEGSGAAETAAPEVTGSWGWEWHDRVNITATSDIEFESSQTTIFVTEYLPWVLLILAVALLCIALLLWLISELRARRRRKDKIHAKRR